MSVNRRNFIKALGITGGALLGTKSLNAKSVLRDIEMKSILIDTTRCEGCQSCEFACAEANGLPEPIDEPIAGFIRPLQTEQFTVVNCYDTSKGEMYVKKQCFHCNQPACDAACLTKAMNKTDEGPVVWREDKCMGCRYCMISCPFEIPKFEYNSPTPRIRKCSMCWERQQKGDEPACVTECPNDALMFGTRRELLKEAQRRIIESSDIYTDHIYGEQEAGGTGVLYLSSVPFDELGFNTSVQMASFPALTKGFLYSVPSVFILWPMMLLGLYKSTHHEESNDAGGMQ
ncbi:MAG: 4Fe-4S dicluster domain-containing protein [Candidatus Marinimicrobia bacterium]|nr:4Fe-4S dicluster domain-containing protein [Candidatus Neomarinimicrobiota bacterium]